MTRRYERMEDVPDNILNKLGRFVSNVGGKTFVLRGLPPEMHGGVLARYSRASTGLQLTLINEFFDDNGDPIEGKGSELMDRVLNAFGDDSVGELEGIHVGIEDISQIGTKFIEDRRIGGSPIEQSTRYVRYNKKDEQGRWRYLRPKEVFEAGFLDKFEIVNNRTFEVYSEGIIKLSEHFKKQLPRDSFKITIERNGQRTEVNKDNLNSDNEKSAFNTAYNFTIRCAALDVGRCILPSSTLTHLGVFGNGRYFSNLISFMKSNELTESKERAVELEGELKKVIPTFIKRNAANPQLAHINKQMRNLASDLFRGITPRDDRVTLVERAGVYNDEAVSSILFPYTNISLQQIVDIIRNLRDEKKLQIMETYIGSRSSRRDRTGRGIEAGYPLTFDLVGCFAEYRDLERHRILTQQRQDLTTQLGFIMPSEMEEIGLKREVEEVVALMDNLNTDLKHAGIEQAAQYATLFNHRMRFMLGMNLREFQHLVELRTQPAGHFSYRSMAMEMADKVKEKYAWTEIFLNFVNYSDPGNKISRAREQSRIAGKNLARNIDGSLDL